VEDAFYKPADADSYISTPVLHRYLAPHPDRQAFDKHAHRAAGQGVALVGP
jgi:hypothetical protein